MISVNSRNRICQGASTRLRIRLNAATKPMSSARSLAYLFDERAANKPMTSGMRKSKDITVTFEIEGFIR